MAITIDVNGTPISYPQAGDPNWADDATNFAIQTSSAFGQLGLDTGTTVDIPGTLDVTGNTTLDANLSVTGNATITGNLTANGNSNLGNASGDTIAVTGILNVDSGVLYVDPTNNRVGINDTTPSQALDVTGNVAITGNETVGGTLGVTGDVAINTNKFNITATSGNTTIAGTLGVTSDVAVNTNKFNVTASSGNTTVAGTLGVTGNASLSASLLNSDGTVSSPSISFTNNTNAGLYRIGANNLGISVSGTKVSDISSLGTLNGILGTELRNILQIVETEYTTQTSRTSTTFGDFGTAFNRSITVKSASSKIIILCIASIGTDATGTVGQLGLARNTTLISGSTGNVMVSTFSNASWVQQSVFGCADAHGQSVGTVLTYAVYGRAAGGATIIYLNRTSSGTAYPALSKLQLIEVL